MDAYICCLSPLLALTRVLTVPARYVNAGVSSMGVTGGDKDQLEVIGVDVDTVCLVKCLRKKLGHADILKVEEVKDKKAEEKKKPEEPKIIVDPPPYYNYYPGYGYYYHQPAPWWYQ
ncbi:hypothetical protein HU200_032205 [Digitaria exilis]|uniref:Uncharacterized protein n=1 Tax=Digitaria exilis TaxID=1010633 RepID=A0A835BNC2_9POAL|nr:hypothetical protein HU200_032205 [Digitaria exilis]